MVHYYKAFQSHSDALAMVDYLKSMGVEKDDMSIIMRSPMGVKVATDDELKAGVKLPRSSKTPEGFVSLLGAFFAPITALTGGLLLLITSPLTALLGTITVGLSSILLLVQNMGALKEKHLQLFRKYTRSKVLIHVETKKRRSDIENLFYSHSFAE